MSKRVLICDDSMLMRRMVADTLQADGWTVVGEASDGREAVALFEELRPLYDGLYALPRILQIEPTAKVVVVSALAQTKMISEAIRAGAQDFIVKPFMPEQLQQTLSRCTEALSA
jgi:two-component system chemotaxis response regulator CheY